MCCHPISMPICTFLVLCGGELRRRTLLCCCCCCRVSWCVAYHYAGEGEGGRGGHSDNGVGETVCTLASVAVFIQCTQIAFRFITESDYFHPVPPPRMCRESSMWTQGGRGIKGELKVREKWRRRRMTHILVANREFNWDSNLSPVVANNAFSSSSSLEEFSCQRTDSLVRPSSFLPLPSLFLLFPIPDK